MNGELLPPGQPLEGEFLPGNGFGQITDHHAPEKAVEPLLGKPTLADQLSPEWVIGRLMREATDFGTRSRQTARVSALKTLADVLGMTEKKEPGEEKSAVQRALEELPPEERRDLIRQKLEKLGYQVKREP